MSKLATLIAKLAKKAGVNTDSDEFKALDIPDVDVPDEMAATIDTGLMNEKAALSNSKIRSTIKAEALNGIDALITQIIEAEQLQGVDEIITGSSFDKVKKLYAHQKAAFNQKLKDNVKPGGAEKENYEKEIASLQEELKNAKKSLTDKQTEFDTTRESDHIEFEIQKNLLGKEYSLPNGMDKGLVIQTALTAINNQLAAKGFKVMRNPDTKALTIVKMDGSPAYSDSHEPVEVNSFFDGALAQNKLLKVSDEQPGGGGGEQKVITPGGGQEKGNAAIVQEIDADLKLFQ